MLELWEMQSTPLSLLLPGPLWPGVVAPDMGPIYGLNRVKQSLAFTVFMHLNCVFMLNWIIWNKTVLTLTLCIAQLAGAVEYTDCTSAEG